ncbi:MAG TPA: PqqD family protein [Chloroflexota bacterium]|nr:PqqD family protein [Chloroflexota bacterium]
MLDTRRPRRTPGYLVGPVPSSNADFVLADPTGRCTLRVNRSVGLIWGLCDGHRAPREIVRLLLDAYPERADNMDSDVRETLIALTEYGAIEWVP